MIPSRYLILYELKNKKEIFLILNKKEKAVYLIKQTLCLFLGIFIIPFAFISHLILSFINFFTPVRIGCLNSRGKISFIISHIEPVVRELKLKHPNKKPIIIIINSGSDPNEQITKMYKRVIFLFDEKDFFLRFFFKTQHMFFSARSKINVFLREGNRLGFKKAWNEGEPVSKFSDKEKEKGLLLLKNLGVPGDAEYICIAIKESVYYKQFSTKEAKLESNFGYGEDHKETSIRDPSLLNYLPIMNECAKKGFYVLRMGQMIDKHLPKNLHPKIIDYANKCRTPFGDVYLLANCKFVIAGGGPGLWWLSTMFNKPVVFTDAYNLNVFGIRYGDLCIPQKWQAKNGRFLTFREVIDKGYYYSFKSNCDKDGIKMVKNTPKEIISVINEMIIHLNDTWKETRENLFLQEKFNNLFKPEDVAYKMPGKIGAEFLKKYKNLIK